jgi:hypothetical protein
MTVCIFVTMNPAQVTALGMDQLQYSHKLPTQAGDKLHSGANCRPGTLEAGALT